MFMNWAQEVHQIYQRDLECNPDSTEERCLSFMRNHGDGYALMKYRAFYSLGLYGNANVHENDKCVKLMITQPYWMNGAMNLSLSLLFMVIYGFFI